jgi:hypothetical protein
MKMLKLSVLLSSLLLIVSCFHPNLQSGRSPYYPPDFAKAKGRMLVVVYHAMHVDKRYDKYTTNYFAKYYTGEYDYIDDSLVDLTTYEIKNPVYSDIKKYKYIFLRFANDGSFTKYGATSPSGTTYGGWDFSFAVYDRESKILYRTKTIAGGRPTLRDYVKKLEAVRKGN